MTAAGAAEPDRPLVLKIPEWQTATLFVLAALGLFVAIYLHLPLVLRILCVMAGVLVAVGAVVAHRAFLVVDDDGIGARGWFGEDSADWDQLQRLEVVQHRGALTVRVVRDDGTSFDIPPAVVLPLKPTPRGKMIAQLKQLIRLIEARAPSR